MIRGGVKLGNNLLRTGTECRFRPDGTGMHSAFLNRSAIKRSTGSPLALAIILIAEFEI